MFLWVSEEETVNKVKDLSSANGPTSSPENRGPMPVTRECLNCDLRKHDANVYNQDGSHCCPTIPSSSIKNKALFKPLVRTDRGE